MFVHLLCLSSKYREDSLHLKPSVVFLYFFSVFRTEYTLVDKIVKHLLNTDIYFYNSHIGYTNINNCKYFCVCRSCSNAGLYQVLSCSYCLSCDQWFHPLMSCKKIMLSYFDKNVSFCGVVLSWLMTCRCKALLLRYLPYSSFFSVLHSCSELSLQSLSLDCWSMSHFL